MKIILVVLMLMSFIVISKSGRKELFEWGEDIKRQCAIDYNIGDVAITNVLTGQFLDGPNMDKFALCFFKNSGFMSENGDLNVDFITKVMVDTIGIDGANQIISTCGDKFGSTLEESAFLLTKCFYDIAPTEN